MNIVGQDKLVAELSSIFEIFSASNGVVRPHFMLTGASGTGKSLTIASLCKENDLNFIEINAAALTKEGTSGNSLSKALTPLTNLGNKLTIVFVDEFDKLFISGNSNSDLAHESTNGVQNEFLKVLESDTASVFGDYGKYIQAKTSNCLFVFAGAFNGQEDITIDDLREFGIKTEFIGRVGLCFNTAPLTLENLFSILEGSDLLENYLGLFKDQARDEVIGRIKEVLTKGFELNTLGARQVNTLIHQYFIKGGNMEEAKKTVTFNKQLSFK